MNVNVALAVETFFTVRTKSIEKREREKLYESMCVCASVFSRKLTRNTYNFSRTNRKKLKNSRTM